MLHLLAGDKLTLNELNIAIKLRNKLNAKKICLNPGLHYEISLTRVSLTQKISI